MTGADEINIVEIPFSAFTKYVYLYSSFASNLVKLEQKIHVAARVNIGPKINTKDLILPAFSDYEEKSLKEICELFPRIDRQQITNTITLAYKDKILDKIGRGLYVRGSKYHIFMDVS